MCLCQWPYQLPYIRLQGFLFVPSSWTENAFSKDYEYALIMKSGQMQRPAENLAWGARNKSEIFIVTQTTKAEKFKGIQNTFAIPHYGHIKISRTMQKEATEKSPNVGGKVENTSSKEHSTVQQKPFPRTMRVRLGIAYAS